jgi:hypothetical protein
MSDLLILLAIVFGPDLLAMAVAGALFFSTARSS